MADCGSSGRFQSFFQEALERALPLSLQWDLTWRCDHKCVHCYLVDRHQNELTLEEGIGILELYCIGPHPTGLTGLIDGYTE